MGWLSKAAEPFYSLLRLAAGGMFACHGAQKVLGAFSNAEAPLAARAAGDWTDTDLLNGVLGSVKPHLSLIGLIALVGGPLIAIGLCTRLAALLASAAMVVNYLLFHAAGSFWPIVNHGELAALYCFIFLYVAARGSVRFGIDAWFRKPAAAAVGVIPEGAAPAAERVQ
jgi:putative oxidoreductase